MTRIFINIIIIIIINLLGRVFKVTKNGLFYCKSILGCQVIEDFDVCKLDDLWRHDVDTQITKK